MISRAAFKYAVNSARSELFVIAASAIQDKLDPNPTKHPDYPANIVTEAYHEYLTLLAKEEVDKLPLHRYVDHEIPIGNNKAPMGRMYSMSDSELAEVLKWITENLSKGFIRASPSSCASPTSGKIFCVRTDVSVPCAWCVWTAQTPSLYTGHSSAAILH